MDIKEFLKTSPLTRRTYHFLFLCKYSGVRSTIRQSRYEHKVKRRGITTTGFDCVIPPAIHLADRMDANRPKIYACAYRFFDVKRGMTGGPGGVLAMQKKQVGDHYRGYDVQYVFAPEPFRYPPKLIRQIGSYPPGVQMIFRATYYVTHCLRISDEMLGGVEPIFVCHDMGSAYGAYLNGWRYVLVYHQQGGLINELEGFSVELTDKDRFLINTVEQAVFEHASKVFFPSMGAAEAYCATSDEGRERRERIPLADYALYNTIPDEPQKLDWQRHVKKLGLPVPKDADVFLSIGDFNYNKGMERVPEVLEAYVRTSGRKALWIAIGSKTDIYDELVAKKDSWNFDSVLIGQRTSHDAVLSLIRYADYYIMLQRVSIFDLSVLEAMRGGTALILANTGGNLEVNLEDNIVLWEEGQTEQTVEEIPRRDREAWGAENAAVFEKYFSKEQFFARYSKMLDDEIDKAGYLHYGRSEKNLANLSPWKDRYKGRKAVICGSGSSLDDCDGADQDAVYIALNRALFYDKVNFDMVFMQDLPQNQPYTIEDYNQYPCTKFYGTITNPKTKGIGFAFDEYTDCNGEIVNYDLAPRWFDYRVDDVAFDLDGGYVQDMQSVMFSAVQFAVFAGFTEIVLYGVEFSQQNYGRAKNPNTYSYYVQFNIRKLKDVISKRHPEIKFRFGSTANKELYEYFKNH